MSNLGSQVRAILGGAFAGAAALFSDLAVAQSGVPVPSSVRSWGEDYLDTAVWHGRVQSFVGHGDWTAVLRTDGRVFVHGPDAYGTSRVPPLPPGTSFTSVSLGSRGAAALRSDGEVVFWGIVNPASGLLVPAPPPGMRYLEVSVGGDHALLLRSDRLVVAVGDNYHGQCSVPSWPAGVWPVSVQAMGDASTALLSDGTIAVWGANHWGINNVPPLPVGVTYRAYDLGWEHALAVRSDGQVVAWGMNQFGECNIPALPQGLTYLAASAGTDFSLLLRSDGTALAWGDNTYRQLDIPPLQPGEVVQEVSAGNAHAIARTTRRMLQWGAESGFQLVPSLPTHDGGLPSARHVDAMAGYYSGFFILSDGTIQAFGNAKRWAIGVPPLPPGLKYVKVVGSQFHAMALRSDGQVVAWGNNSVGQCNVPALPVGMTYTDLVVGSGHSVVLRSDGQALAFGSNTGGPLNIPSLPPGLRYVDIDAGYSFTMLRRSDGAVVFARPAWFWLSSFPAPPPGTEYRTVRCGSSDAVALCTDGTVVQLPPSSPVWWFRVVPTLPFGVYFVEADTGEEGIALRSSDGLVQVCGDVGWRVEEVPPLEPGTSYVQVRADGRQVTARVGPTSTYVAFAPGCAGSSRAARLVPMDTPRIGKVHEVNMFDLPQDVAFLLFGWTRTAPLSLAPYGMPGCATHVSPDGAYVVVGQNGMAKYRLPIPNLPALVGLDFFNQAVVLDAGAGNPLGAVLSDAAEGVIGHW